MADIVQSIAKHLQRAYDEFGLLPLSINYNWTEEERALLVELQLRTRNIYEELKAMVEERGQK